MEMLLHVHILGGFLFYGGISLWRLEKRKGTTPTSNNNVVSSHRCPDELPKLCARCGYGIEYYPPDGMGRGEGEGGGGEWR